VVDGAEGFNMKIARVGAVAAGLLCLAGAANADVISFQSANAESTDHLGSFVGTISYSQGPGANSGVVTLSITNTTTPESEGGYITGIAFNFDSEDPGAMLSLTSGPAHFQAISDVSAPPFGVFDFGAALGGSWVGGGNPHPGIELGATGTFVFEFTGSDADTRQASDFIFPSSSGSGGRDAIGMAVRFRGFANGGSDKVPGAPVPSQGAIGLMGVGGIVLLRRRR
jgi:MYXO-CTERM domain-containing protein